MPNTTPKSIESLKVPAPLSRKLNCGLETCLRNRTRELTNARIALASEIRMRAAIEKNYRTLSTEVQRVQDEERRRIARELHDGTGQTLSALKMSLGALEKSFPAIAGARHLSEARQLVDEALREIRTTSYLLHPPLLDESGLESALRWFTSGYGERSNVEMSLTVQGLNERLPAEYELCLFRVAQECLTNVHRHSESKTAVIRLERSAEAVKLEVIDYGKGVSKDLQRKIAMGESTGVGLRGMQERVRKLDGRMEMLSGKRGTTVTVLLPILRDVPTKDIGA